MIPFQLQKYIRTIMATELYFNTQTCKNATNIGAYEEFYRKTG